MKPSPQTAGRKAPRFVGIDVGAQALHCVVLDERLEVVAGRLVEPKTSELAEMVADATLIAIDAPAALSTAPHADDETLAPKFRSARCCEIALGREHGYWVPWVTPIEASRAPAWMTVGFRLYAALAGLGRRAIEVYPYAGFCSLGGARPAKKTSAAGLRERIALLRREGLDAPDIELWSHDGLDAALAALIAAQAHDGAAVPVGCGCDGSAIWLPRPA